MAFATRRSGTTSRAVSGCRSRCCVTWPAAAGSCAARAAAEHATCSSIYNEPNYESFLFVIWARLLGYRVVVDIVEDAYFIADAAPLFSRLKARSARWATAHLRWFADGVIVISSYLQQKLEHIVGARLPVALIPISVDLDRMRRVPGGFHRPARLLYAGSFGEKDGVENLIAAFEQVAGQGRDIELVMTGRGSAERMAMCREADPAVAGCRADPAISASFRMTITSAPSPTATFSASFACPPSSPTGASRSSSGEYLATGRPVIASRVSDVASYLSDRVNAMLVEPGSVPEIVAAIEYLLADEARAFALGRAGRLVAERHFSARNNGRQLLELFDRIGVA